MAIKIAGQEVINDDKELVLAKLAEVNASIADTAVDVFVYDTRKDSDGGAWRKRTQHTSWYNETLNTATRGARKEFPAVAVIVAESNKVTIYDGDDPSLPMWMVFNDTGSAGALGWNTNSLSTVRSLSMLNGYLVVGWNGAGVVCKFVEDDIRLIHSGTVWTLTSGRLITDRNNTTTIATGDAFNVVNGLINDVAMTVLPNAPIDSATGLPVPTIACLVGESEVTLADGSTVRLDQVEVGSKVKTLEGEHEVLNWWDQGVKEVIELEFDGGQTLICTTDHKIRTTSGWVEAGALTSEHEVIGL